MQWRLGGLRAGTAIPITQFIALQSADLSPFEHRFTKVGSSPVPTSAAANSAGLLLNTTQPFEQKRRTPDCRAPVKADRPHQEDQTHDTRRARLGRTHHARHLRQTHSRDSHRYMPAEHAHHRADLCPHDRPGCTRTDPFANGLTQFCTRGPTGSTSTIVAATTPPVGALHQRLRRSGVRAGHHRSDGRVVGRTIKLIESQQ